MHSRNKASSEDGGGASPGRNETVVSKTGIRNVTQGGAKNIKAGSGWEESVVEKWRGALVKARLALQKKREKKKEQYRRLRKIADAARKPQEVEEVPLMPLPKKKRGRPPLAAKAGNAQQVLAAMATERTSTKVLKKARTTSGRSQADDGDLSNESIPSITKVKRGRKPSSITTADVDQTDVAKLRAKMERREEIRNKLRKGLEIARTALKKKRELRKEKAQKAAITRLQRSQDGAVQDDTTQVVFSLRRPSLEELREFARKSRC